MSHVQHSAVSELFPHCGRPPRPRYADRPPPRAGVDAGVGPHLRRSLTGVVSTPDLTLGAAGAVTQVHAHGEYRVVSEGDPPPGLP